MKKRLLSAVLTAALTLASMTAVPFTVTAETAPEADISAENAQTKNYWIFYRNIDTSEIDSIITEKSHEYEYSLYDTVSDQREIERMVTDYSQKLRLDMLEKAYAEKSAEILAELGVETSAAWCSSFTPSIVCPLTDEQYEYAKNMEIITDISEYESIFSETVTDLKNKDDIITELTRDKEGRSVCDDNVKFDVVFNAGIDNKTDYLVVYGLKSRDDISTVKNQLDKVQFWENPIMELYSGVELYDISIGIGRNPIRAIIFVEDELPGWSVKETTESYSKRVGFDVSPYIISLGDTNSDYKINAVDASEVLTAYAKTQTQNDFSLTAEQLKHFDVNSDGTVNAVDASDILSYYAFTATGGTASLTDFLK